MTSKLGRTIVGVGIALGSAAPGCFGRSFDDDAVGSDDDVVDAGDTSDGSVDAALDANDTTDGSVDAALDASDPFCDVAWPPTKGNPTPGIVPCVDPLRECTDAFLPRRCYKLIEPSTCSRQVDSDGPLYCVDGKWQCPPGTTDDLGCRCWAESADAGACPDAAN